MQGMENKDNTQAQAVNEEQKNVQVTPETQNDGANPAQAEPVVQNTDVNEFKTAEDEPKQGKLEPWMEERLARERRSKQKERERAETERARAEAAERELLMMRAANSSRIPSQPNPQQPNDPIQAVKNLVRETLLEAEKDRSEREAQAVQQRTQLEFQAKMSRGIEKYDDFAEVIDQPYIPITERMAEFIKTIPNPEDFSYNLIKFNADKLLEISKLHPVMQAVQMNELYKGFSAKSGRKTTTQAPPPPVGMRASNTGAKNQNDMSYDEVKQLLNGGRRKT